MRGLIALCLTASFAAACAGATQRDAAPTATPTLCSFASEPHGKIRSGDPTPTPAPPERGPCPTPYFPSTPVTPAAR